MFSLHLFRHSFHAAMNATAGFIAFDEAGRYEFNEAARLQNGLHFAYISLVATVAEIIFRKVVDTAAAKFNWSPAVTHLVKQGGVLAIYATAVITPVALGMLSMSGTLLLGALYGISFYISYLQSEHQLHEYMVQQELQRQPAP